MIHEILTQISVKTVEFRIIKFYYRIMLNYLKLQDLKVFTEYYELANVISQLSFR